MGLQPSKGGNINNAAVMKITASSLLWAVGGVQMRLAGGGISTVADGAGSVNFFIDGPIISTSSFTAESTEIGQYDDRTKSPTVAEYKEYMREEREVAAAVIKVIKDAVYATNKVGNYAWYRKVTFSFNPSLVYGAVDSFILNSTFWQAAFEKQGSPVWVQPTVRFHNSTETRPWPGQAAWTGDSYGKMDVEDLKNVDAETGAGKESPKDDTEGEDVEVVPLKGNYRIDTQGD